MAPSEEQLPQREPKRRSASRYLKLLYLLVGVGLLALVVVGVDMQEVWAAARRISWLGMLAVIAIFFAAFAIDSFTWQLALVQVPLNARWLYRTWKIRMVGEVFNTVIPAAGFGGEPLKAVLFKEHYGIGYREASASLILGKTVNLLALIAFLAAGFALILFSPLLPDAYKIVAGVGLFALCFGVAGFFMVQRLKLSTVAGAWLSGRRVGRKLGDVLHHVRDIDDRLVHFYARRRGRFAAAVGLAFVNWLAGVVEIYVTMIFLGHPVSIWDAWIIEAIHQLVRAGAFLIPAGIGVQEGTFLLVYAAMTGSAELGVAVALIRRFREAVWLVWGAMLGAGYWRRSRARPAEGADAALESADARRPT
ncbi:MAG: flippase-like domain-containing protein [Rhodospirillales bacterium]|nr:flippase-like domain-containing protein [Rhodospirillales bacterium]